MAGGGSRREEHRSRRRHGDGLDSRTRSRSRHRRRRKSRSPVSPRKPRKKRPSIFTDGPLQNTGALDELGNLMGCNTSMVVPPSLPAPLACSATSSTASTSTAQPMQPFSAQLAPALLGLTGASCSAPSSGFALAVPGTDMITGGGSSLPAVRPPTQKVCIMFLATSACEKGDQCPLKHPTEPEEVAYWHELFKKTPCKWGETCKWRPRCIYFHPQSEAAPVPPPDGAPATSSKVCLMHLMSHCDKGDQCAMRHPSDPTEIMRWLDTFKRTPCKWGAGCKWRSTCIFAHAELANGVPVAGDGASLLSSPTMVYPPAIMPPPRLPGMGCLPPPSTQPCGLLELGPHVSASRFPPSPLSTPSINRLATHPAMVLGTQPPAPPKPPPRPPPPPPASAQCSARMALLPMMVQPHAFPQMQPVPHMQLSPSLTNPPAMSNLPPGNAQALLAGAAAETTRHFTDGNC